jgi:hypothetical protein
MPINSTVRGSFGPQGKFGKGALGTISNPALSGKALYDAGIRTDGIFWLNPTGTNAFQAYVINSRDGGGWVKFLQYYNGADLSGTASVNENGSWINSEINTNQAGKLRTADINSLITGNSFLFRVTGSADRILNDRQGTGKYTGSTVLPAWGTDRDPSSHSWYVDINNSGTYPYYANYGNDPQGRCTHGSGVYQWPSDHNYNGLSGALPTGLGYPICWGFYPAYMGTNLHFMSGIANNQSNGELWWGSSRDTGTAASVFVK